MRPNLLAWQWQGYSSVHRDRRNLALHLANTLLVFALFVRWTGKLGRSALVAALFGVHPMHVESVAWIVERRASQPGQTDLDLAILAALGVRSLDVSVERVDVERHRPRPSC